MKHLGVLFLMVSALALTGCLNRPGMELWGAQVRDAGPPGLTMNMIMKVRNENSFDIQIRNVRANVVLANRYALPPIVASPNTWLPSGRVTHVTVPVTIPWNMVPAISAAAALGPYVTFRVNGFADVTGTRSLKIDKNDWVVNDQGRVSSAEIIAATGRGHLPMLPGFQMR